MRNFILSVGFLVFLIAGFQVVSTDQQGTTATGTGQGKKSLDPSKYPLTIASLKERYADEIQAMQKYEAYASKARKEGYPNIAHLFSALAMSEAIHAKNFERLLKQLDVDVEKRTFSFSVGKTKHNIRHATEVEVHEIAHEYPNILKQIEAEKHQDAIQNITYAWKAERQHRDLMMKIQRAAKRWFGMLAAKIEGEPTHYYVCRVCGSTLVELPKKQCPICKHAVKHYQEVPGFPGKQEDDEGD